MHVSSKENMSAEQSVQMLVLLAPVTFEYPVGQLVQMLAPVALEYVPATQFVHTLTLPAPETLEDLPVAH